MGQINRIPNGFLDLLGTETGGRNPSSSPELVSPTLRMNELYSSQTLSVVNWATNSTNVGDSNSITIGNDETWILYSASMNTNSPLAGDRDVISMSLDRLPRDAAGAAPPQIFVADLLSLSVDSDPTDALVFPVPFVLGHGVIVRIDVVDRLGGAANRVVNATLLIGRLVG